MLFIDWCGSDIKPNINLWYSIHRMTPPNRQISLQKLSYSTHSNPNFPNTNLLKDHSSLCCVYNTFIDRRLCFLVSSIKSFFYSSGISLPVIKTNLYVNLNVDSIINFIVNPNFIIFINYKLDVQKFHLNSLFIPIISIFPIYSD